MEQSQAVPKVRHKTFTYHTGIRWIEGRLGDLSSGDKPVLRVSSPPEFKGSAGVWTPEDLFVASVELCTMVTFVALAQRAELAFRSYVSSAEGILEFGEQGYEFTRVILRPVIGVSSADAVPLAEKIIHDAHNGCLIARSIRSTVDLEPVVRVDANGG